MTHIIKRVHPTIVPIEFKEINPSDFPDYLIEGRNKIIISPDEKGYIGRQLKSVINLEDNNTVIINAGVGDSPAPTVLRPTPCCKNLLTPSSACSCYRV